MTRFVMGIGETFERFCKDLNVTNGDSISYRYKPVNATSSWSKVEESKRQMRRRLAALPFAEKLRILEDLRDRNAALKTNPLRRGRSSPSFVKKEGPP